MDQEYSYSETIKSYTAKSTRTKVSSNVDLNLYEVTPKYSKLCTND